MHHLPREVLQKRLSPHLHKALTQNNKVSPWNLQMALVFINFISFCITFALNTLQISFPWSKIPIIKATDNFFDLRFQFKCHINHVVFMWHSISSVTTTRLPYHDTDHMLFRKWQKIIQAKTTTYNDFHFMLWFYICCYPFQTVV